MCLGDSVDGWIFAIELRGALTNLFAPGGEAAAAVLGNQLRDVNAAAALAGVAEGMTERAAMLRLPSLRLEAVTPALREAAYERLRQGLSALSDEVRCEGERGALLPFLALPAAALRTPWADACARLVPAYGFSLEGAAGPSAWAARALLAAARAGEGKVERLTAAGGQLFVGDWRDLAPTIMTDVAPADQERLRRQGVRTLGQLAALPTIQRQRLVGPLWARRLGGEDEEAARADAGRHTVARRVGGAPGDATALETALDLLAAEAAGHLALRGEGVRQILLDLVAEGGEEARLERGFLFPLLPSRLAGAVKSLVWTHASLQAPVSALRLTVAGAPMGWAQARLTGRRRSPPAWALPTESLGGPRRSRRLRREARLSLWDPLRGGLGDAPTR
jgi:hypothetical protein